MMLATVVGWTIDIDWWWLEKGILSADLTQCEGALWVDIELLEYGTSPLQPGKKMTEEFWYVWSLPLFEKPFETAALDVSDTVRALSAKYKLPASVVLQPPVATALTSHSEYWSGLALKWLDDGFPISQTACKPFKS